MASKKYKIKNNGGLPEPEQDKGTAGTPAVVDPPKPGIKDKLDDVLHERHYWTWAGVAKNVAAALGFVAAGIGIGCLISKKKTDGVIEAGFVSDGNDGLTEEEGITPIEDDEDDEF